MKNRIDVTAALIFERIPRFPLPIDLIPVHSHAEMSETVWDLLNLVREVESPPYAEHRALFDGLTEATWIAKPSNPNYLQEEMLHGMMRSSWVI